jgi:hypothetical protein
VALSRTEVLKRSSTKNPLVGNSSNGSSLEAVLARAFATMFLEKGIDLIFKESSLLIKLHASYYKFSNEVKYNGYSSLHTSLLSMNQQKKIDILPSNQEPFNDLKLQPHTQMC